MGQSPDNTYPNKLLWIRFFLNYLRVILVSVTFELIVGLSKNFDKYFFKVGTSYKSYGLLHSNTIYASSYSDVGLLCMNKFHIILSIIPFTIILWDLFISTWPLMKMKNGKPKFRSSTRFLNISTYRYKWFFTKARNTRS